MKYPKEAYVFEVGGLAVEATDIDDDKVWLRSWNERTAILSFFAIDFCFLRRLARPLTPAAREMMKLAMKRGK